MVSPDVQVRSELWKRQGCGSFLESSGDGHRDDGRLPSRRADMRIRSARCAACALRLSRSQRSQRPSADFEPSFVLLFAAVLINR